MELYTSAGWLDVPGILPGAPPFNIIVGGRGTGKTFGFLEEFRLVNPRPFILMRRSQVETDLISNPDFTPFRALDRVRGCTTVIKKLSKYHAGIYNGELNSDGTVSPAGPLLGYTAALSTLHNVRGFSADEILDLILDEFNPEKGSNKIPDEFGTFQNAYETVNRNRELEDPPRPPLRAWLLANSNNLGNPYFIGLGIVEQVDKMIRKGISVWTDEARGLRVIILNNSPISAAKASTALYRLGGSGTFRDMALGTPTAR